MIVTSKYSDYKRCCYKQKRGVICVCVCVDRAGGRKEKLYVLSVFTCIVKIVEIFGIKNITTKQLNMLCNVHT